MSAEVHEGAGSSASSSSSSSSAEGDTNNNNNNNDPGSSEESTFECNICLEAAGQPVITMCGHLYCWPCIYKWMQLHLDNPQCPVCKSAIATEKLIPLYGRGKENTDPRKKIPEGIPNRPPGHQTEAPPHPHHHHYPFGAFPGMPTAQFGGISISGGIGFFPSLFGLQFQTYGNAHYPQNGPQGEADRQTFLSRMLLMLAMMVLFFLLFF